jgi:hypothetical protein
MPILITDKERAVMASAVRQTVKTLENGKFAADVLVTRSASSATSKISSIYKRHGTILQKALGIAINTDPTWTAWDEVELSNASYRKGLRIDLILYDGKVLRIFEVKRGLGKQDSDAKKGIKARLNTAKLESNQIFKKCKITPVANVECGVVSYYGTHAKAAGFRPLTRDGLEKEFAGISNFIEEVDNYLKFKLDSETVGDFLSALRELDIEVPQDMSDAVGKRRSKSHPWDNLGV